MKDIGRLYLPFEVNSYTQTFILLVELCSLFSRQVWYLMLLCVNLMSQSTHFWKYVTILLEIDIETRIFLEIISFPHILHINIKSQKRLIMQFCMKQVHSPFVFSQDFTTILDFCKCQFIIFIGVTHFYHQLLIFFFSLSL